MADWAHQKAVEIFSESGSELQLAAKENFLCWLAGELRKIKQEGYDAGRNAGEVPL